MRREHDPYRLKPRERMVREAQKLIQIRDDSVRPPASVGVDSFQGILFGAPSQQPSKTEEAPRNRLLEGAALLLIVLVPVLLAVRYFLS